MSIKKILSNKLFTIILLYIVAFVIVATLYVTERNTIHEDNLNQALSQIESTKSGIISQMDLLDTLYINQVKASMNTFVRNGLEKGTPSLGFAVSFADKKVPNLMLGESSVVKNYELVDMHTDDVGGTATLFVNSGNEFVRVSTNVIKDDGSRADGTVLTKGGKVEKLILSGSPYYGLVNILGKPYLTGYEPMYDAQNKIVGIWYVGYPLEQIDSLSESIKGKKVFDNDFYVITNELGTIIAKSNDMSDEQLLSIIASSESSDEWTVSTATFEKWGYNLIAGVKNSDIKQAASKKSYEFLFNIGIIFVLFSAFIIYFVIATDRTNKKIAVAAKKLSASADFVTNTSVSLNDSSVLLSEGSTQQAAAIEETSATMEENSSMIKQNAENTKHANNLSREAISFAEEGSGKMQDMLTSMDKIKKSSSDIAKIIKVIDDIAFQTNMLALNAAVEAARAGDAGQGFSVVAEEVRNLAQKSAKAAKDTASIIEENITLSEQGAKMSDDVNHMLTEIMDKTDGVNKLIEEITAASEEQARGSSQITEAISQMDVAIQNTASTAQGSATNAKELMQQAHALQEVISELNKLVNSSSK